MLMQVSILQSLQKLSLSEKFSDPKRARFLSSYTDFIINSMKMKKEDIIRGLASIRHGKSASADQITSSSLETTTTTTITHHAGSKVLPIIETNSTSSSTRSSQKEANQEIHGDSSDQITRKAKALSRMKELMRWAAAAKAQKGGKYLGRKVLYFRNKGNLKGLNSVDGEFTSDSPKISFRWDVESCSTTSSAISVSSMPPLMNVGRSDRFELDPRKGNWITTDDEFVVLEL